jgi:hypothetical protein
MEFLSRQLNQSSDGSLVNLVNQSPRAEAQGYNAQGTPGFDAHSLPFRVDTDFHEYRFDWVPGKVTFYADNVLLKTMTEDIPTSPGHLVLNHWSNGDRYWSGGPPSADAAMIVTHAHMYFNSSIESLQQSFRKTCPQSDDSKICKIKNDIRIPLMSTTLPSSTSHNGTETAEREAAKKKAQHKGSWGFIITGCVVGVFIIVFIIAMVTVRHWGTWRHKLSRCLGFQKAPMPGPLMKGSDGSKSSSPSTLEMQKEREMAQKRDP